MLWPVGSQMLPPHRVFCGPTATSALIGADVDDIMRLIQDHRGNDRPVEGTSPDELKHVLQQFGCDLVFVAYLAASNPPSLARWERERSDADFERCWLLIIDNHWVAVRGWWICDSLYSKSVPIRIRPTGPHRHTRVEYVYSVVMVNQSRVVRDQCGRIIRARR
jgi:hypothetical protein